MRVFLLVAVLVVLSGTVAYLGDIVGRQVAKRRVSVGAIRPRRVGSYVAVITGMLIALATFGLLTVFSQDVRTWIMEYDRIKSDLAELTTQYETTSQANEALKASAARIEGQLDEKQKELTKLTGELGNAKQDLSEATLELSENRQELSSITGQLTENENDLRLKQAELDKAGATQVKLKEDISGLRSENEELKSSRDALRNEIEVLAEESRMLETETATLEAKRDELQNKITELERQLGELKRQNILIGANQPLAYIAIDPAWTGAQIREAILATQTVLHQKLAAKGYWLKGISTEDMEFILSELAQAKMGKVIILASKENVLPDEPIKPMFIIADNKLCFRKDEIIAEFVVPQGASSDKVEALFVNAVHMIRKKAIERNLLPNIDTGSYGSINYDEIKRLIRKLARSETGYTVYFISSEDVSTVGNLDKINIKYWPL